MKVKKLAYNSTFRKQRSCHLVPSTSWQIDGETMEAVADFIFLGSKITAAMQSKVTAAMKLKDISTLEEKV